MGLHLPFLRFFSAIQLIVPTYINGKIMFDEFILPDQQHSSFSPISEFPNEKLRKTNVGVCPEKKIRLIIILCQDTQKK